jgi:ankyrin repeat protein
MGLSMLRRAAGHAIVLCLLALMGHAGAAVAQRAPSPTELSAYEGLHKAAAEGSVAGIRAVLATGADPNARDSAGRTPAHVAAFGSHYEVVSALVAGGGVVNALEHDRYDVITIAAV